MVKITPNEVNGKTVVSFEGIVDEHFDPTDFPQDGKAYDVDLSGIRRINSIGVKKWIMFFTALKDKGITVNYLALSPALVEQVNLISNFIPRSSIKTVTLPFKCKACGKDVFFVKDRVTALTADLDNVDWACPYCGESKLEFDDVAEDYLNFWNAE